MHFLQMIYHLYLCYPSWWMGNGWLAFSVKLPRLKKDQEAEPILRERRPQPSNITELSALMARTRTARQSWIKTVILTGAVSWILCTLLFKRWMSVLVVQNVYQHPLTNDIWVAQYSWLRKISVLFCAPLSWSLNFFFIFTNTENT